jgi:hypothetical protein
MPMRIKYRKKLIKNLGNYENITIDLELEDEICFAKGETFNSVYETMKYHVSKSLNAECKKIEDYLKSKKGGLK